MSTCVIRHDTWHNTKQSSLPQPYNMCYWAWHVPWHEAVLATTTILLSHHHNCHMVSLLPWCWLHYSAVHVPASPHAYMKAQSKCGSADNTAHLSDVTAHKLQTSWQIWRLCSSLFANSNPPVLVQTLYALCSKVSVTLGGINIVFVTVSGMMASCYFHSSTSHLSFQIKHWALYVPSVCITEYCLLVC